MTNPGGTLYVAFFLIFAACNCVYGGIIGPTSLGISTRTFHVLSNSTFLSPSSYVFNFIGITTSAIFPCSVENANLLICETITYPLSDANDGYYRGTLEDLNSGKVVPHPRLVYVHQETYNILTFTASEGSKINTSRYNIEGGEEISVYLGGDVYYSKIAIIRFSVPTTGFSIDVNADMIFNAESTPMLKLTTPFIEPPEYFDETCPGPTDTFNYSASNCSVQAEMTVSLDGVHFSTVPFPITFSKNIVLRTSFIYPGLPEDYGLSFHLNLGRVLAEAEYKESIDASLTFQNITEGEFSFQQENIGNTSLANTPVYELFANGELNDYYPGFTLMQELCSQNINLIFTCSYGYQMQTLDASFTSACKSSETKFVNIGGISPNNSISVAFAKAYQMRYLTGIIAGEDLKKRKVEFEGQIGNPIYNRACVGYIATIPTPEVQRGMNAFLLGCKSSFPECRVKALWVGPKSGSGTDESAAGFLWHVGECDVLAQHSDTIEAQQYYADRGGSVLSYGIDSRALVGDNVLASVLFNWEVVFNHFISRLQAGIWTEENYFPGVAENAVDLSLLSPKVDQLIKRKISEEKSKLQAALGNDAYKHIFCGTLKASYRYAKDDQGRTILNGAGYPNWEKLAIPTQINRKHYVNVDGDMLKQNTTISENDCLWGSSNEQAGEALLSWAFPEPFDSDKIFNDYLLEGIELFEETETIYGNIQGQTNYTFGAGFFEELVEYPKCDGSQWSREREECDAKTLVTPIRYSPIIIDANKGEVLLCGTNVNNMTGKITTPDTPPYISGQEGAPPCDFLPISSSLGAFNFSMLTINILMQSLILIGMIHFRQERDVIATQPTLMFLMICMSLCLNLSFFLLLGEPTNGICLARIWIMNLSFDFMFALLWAKVYRIYALYKYSKSLKAVQLSTSDMIVLALYIVVLDFGVLVMWTIEDAPIVTSVALSLDIDAGIGGIYRSECASRSNTYLSIALFYKMLLIISNCILVYTLRNIPKVLAEFLPFKAILLSSYFTAIFLSAVLLLSWILDDIIIKHTIYILGGSFGSTVMISALTLPSIIGAIHAKYSVGQAKGRMTMAVDQLYSEGHTSTEQTITTTTQPPEGTFDDDQEFEVHSPYRRPSPSV